MFDLINQRNERLFLPALNPDRQRVDEKADDVVGAGGASRHGHTHHHFVLSCGLHQQVGIRGQQHHERCGSAFTGQLRNPRGNGRRQHHWNCTAVKRGDGRPCVINRQ